MPVTEEVVRVERVKRVFQVGIDRVRALDGVSASVSRGTMVCVYGASGSGKSTLLNQVAGLDVPDEGTVMVEGTELGGLPEGRRAAKRLDAIGVVFQENNLVGEFTAGENVFIPLLARGMSYRDATGSAKRWLERVGVTELFDRYPREMSGGQRQRVGIARALAGERRVLVADEPTGSLDSANSRMLFDLIGSLCHEEGIAALVATHDPLGRDAADEVWTMVDGRIDR